ncbi:MAG TPA: plasmid stabilization protein [Caulobacteraceae bacterium]|nr:plasmid stabilization protein [Caulobacteraceae bacterium]
MMRRLFLVLAMVAAASPAAAVARRAVVHQAKAPAIIVIANMAYGSPPAGLHVGDTVEWVNHDIFLHSATATDHSFDVQLRPGATGTVKLTHAGTIGYTCKYHPGMKSQLVVAK